MSSDFSRRKLFQTIHGKRMAYIEEGQGDPIVFLHGNPTSSFLWRKVMPHLRGRGRLIAPDLIGMGDSDKLDHSGPERYRFVEHRQYLFALLEALGVRERVTLVIHDWGSALGFDWANRHRGRVRGIAYMEGIVRPIAGWEEWSAAATPIFQGFRSEKGEAMILDRNMFVERVLPGSVLRKLSDVEMTEYRKPFLAREDRWPTLTWPRQIPIQGEPADVVAIVADYAKWMAQNDIPKLFVNADPGAILIGPVREFCRSWKNQSEVTVAGSHFIQEDSGAAIGQAIAAWMKAGSL
jgi:haloalkane dehalogenase